MRAISSSLTEASKLGEANWRTRASGVSAKRLDLRRGQAGDARVGDDDALWHAGRAGGVDDIGGVARLAGAAVGIGRVGSGWPAIAAAVSTSSTSGGAAPATAATCRR